MSHGVVFAEQIGTLPCSAVPTSELSGHRMVWVGFLFPDPRSPFGHLRLSGRVEALCLCPCQRLGTQGWKVLPQLLGNMDQNKPLK